MEGHSAPLKQRKENPELWIDPLEKCFFTSREIATRMEVTVYTNSSSVDLIISTLLPSPCLHPTQCDFIIVD